MFENLRRTPNRALALSRYRRLAKRYDASCKRILTAREAAVDALALRKDEIVFDVGCGTGAILPLLARRVGPGGKVIGIEQSPQMLEIARGRIERLGLSDRVSLLCASVEDVTFDLKADALLFCYTHDVLQSSAALANVFNAAKPRARIAVVGARLLPWWFGAPLNVWTLVRGRKYLTTYRGLRRPWKTLVHYCPDLCLLRTFHLGTTYLAIGRLHHTVTAGKPQDITWEDLTARRLRQPEALADIGPAMSATSYVTAKTTRPNLMILPHAAWLVAALPFLCGCESCSATTICFSVSSIVAGGLFAALVIARELWLLQIFRDKP